jgi:hypothetical protein
MMPIDLYRKSCQLTKPRLPTVSLTTARVIVGPNEGLRRRTEWKCGDQFAPYPRFLIETVG